MPREVEGGEFPLWYDGRGGVVFLGVGRKGGARDFGSLKDDQMC